MRRDGGRPGDPAGKCGVGRRRLARAATEQPPAANGSLHAPARGLEGLAATEHLGNDCANFVIPKSIKAVPRNGDRSLPRHEHNTCALQPIDATVAGAAVIFVGIYYYYYYYY
jgi:hypothetical protein